MEQSIVRGKVPGGMDEKEKRLEQRTITEQKDFPEQTTFPEQIKQYFPCQKQDIRTYSPLTLAFIGDGVYELVIRSILVQEANRSANDLHRMAVQYVRAESQAQMILALKPELTETESDVFRRGRNASPHTIPKNATRSDYHKATGFEALVGYLYLTGQTDRMLELIRKGMEALGYGKTEE